MPAHDGYTLARTKICGVTDVPAEDAVESGVPERITSKDITADGAERIAA
jgi:hypothetical protein